MANQPLNIFLADLQNSYYRYIRNSVPIGMGYVAAYLHQQFGPDIKLHLFRKFEDAFDMAQTVRPDIVAFGSYSWNTELTGKAASYFKNRFPDCLIVVGGPDVSPVLSRTLVQAGEWPDVDFFMPNEGEVPTHNVVAARLGGTADDIRRATINGCIALEEDGSARGTSIARFEGDINEIPSPYLNGLMDPFLQNIDYLPIIQTSRGCPYRCTFCVSGKDTWSKVKAFDIERIKTEIDYITGRSVNSYLRFADENFGILRRDVEIAEYMIEHRAKTGFPSAVSIYTDKHPTDRVKEINNLLKELMPFCISFQSTTPDVLKNITRINLKDNIVDDAVSYAREHDLMLVSELIFGLPGESIESFMASVDRLIDCRFESIAINQLRILKGTVMDTPEDRDAFKVQTMFSMSENGYTKHPDLENIEIDEWVVENSSINREEYFLANRFKFLFDLGHFHGYLKELLFFFETLGVRASKLMMEVADRPDQCPEAFGKADDFAQGLMGMLFDTPEEVVDHVKRVMAVDPDSMEGVYRLEDRLLIEILVNGKLSTVVDEVASVGRDLYIAQNGSADASFDEQLAAICKAVVSNFIPLEISSPDTITIDSPFDLAAWASEGFATTLDKYRKTEGAKTQLKIRSSDIYHDLWDNDDVPLDRYIRYFATVNSSNRRRIMLPAQ